MKAGIGEIHWQVKKCQRLPTNHQKLREEQGTDFPSCPQKKPTVWTPSSCTSSLQNYDIVHFCCLTTSLWYFLMGSLSKLICPPAEKLRINSIRSKNSSQAHLSTVLPHRSKTTLSCTKNTHICFPATQTESSSRAKISSVFLDPCTWLVLALHTAGTQQTFVELSSFWVGRVMTFYQLSLCLVGW